MSAAADGELIFPAEGSFSIDGLEVKSLTRAILRLQSRKTNLVFNDAKLEGVPFTEPEVVTLVEGHDLDTVDDHDANIVLALSAATDELITLVRSGAFALTKSSSDRLHGLVGEFEALDAGRFRGEGSAEPTRAAVNVMGERFEGPEPGSSGHLARQRYVLGLAELAKYRHPALRAVGYAAFATYNQFYFDANKRTARLMMNGELMLHGFDAIVTPYARREEYNAALRDLFMNADLRPYMAFLLSCYDG